MLDREKITEYPLGSWGFFMMWELSATSKCGCLRECIMDSPDFILNEFCYTQDCPLPESFGGVLD